MGQLVAPLSIGEKLVNEFDKIVRWDCLLQLGDDGGVAAGAQRQEAEKQLETMANANSAAMKDMQAGVDKAWKEMEKSMESARKRFE